MEAIEKTEVLEPETADAVQVSETTPVLTEKVPAADNSPQVDELRLTARQWAQARGIRLERAAGFLCWSDMRLGAGAQLTAREWQPLWTQFLGSPVR